MIDLDATREVVELASGRWVLLVLIVLATGPRGHNDLVRTAGVEQKTLDRVLHRLEDDGLVVRDVRIDRSPLRVDYHLTKRAQCLLDALACAGDRWRQSQWDMTRLEGSRAKQHPGICQPQ